MSLLPRHNPRQISFTQRQVYEGRGYIVEIMFKLNAEHAFSAATSTAKIRQRRLLAKLFCHQGS
jgi:hypothetical protein